MLIPNNIDSFESNGERLLYLRFLNDKACDNMFILHSVFTNHHIKHISGELDFLVLAPNKGIFAIEVKHGKVFRKDGTWNFVNRHGKVTSKKKGPFAQVDGTMNSIRKYVLGKFDSRSKEYQRISKILWGTGVAFTSMDEFIDFGTEAHSWQILTKQGLNYPPSMYIEALSKGWHSENNGKYWYNKDEAKPSNHDCELILKALRGDFEIEYSELNRITESEVLIEEFTKEQFYLLDFVNYNKRCLIEGPAGTGKTLMALELFQREFKKGHRVAFFCYNKNLGNQLCKSISSSLDIDDLSYVGTLHSFLLARTKISVPNDVAKLKEFYSIDLPISFLLEGALIENEYDYLILDESQDLISSYYTEVFDTILTGGLKSGNWTFFGDFTNQAIYNNTPESSIKLLQEKTNFSHLPPLVTNCRNTRHIANLNTVMTGIDLPNFKKGSIDGDKTIIKFPSPGKQLNELESILISLKESGVPSEKITILSPKRFENTYAKNSKLIVDFEKLGMCISTIHSFKGLENTIIILFDFDELISDKSQKLLYVGISRARQQLYIVLNKVLENDYKELILLNSPKLK